MPNIIEITDFSAPELIIKTRIASRFIRLIPPDADL